MKELIKVAFDSQAFTSQSHGGVSRYFCSLVMALNEINGVVPKLFAPFHINQHISNVPTQLFYGFKVPMIPFTGKIRNFLGLTFSRAQISHFHPQVLHETYYSTFSRAPKNCKTVITVHDMIHELFPQYFSLTDLTARRKAESVRRADRIICVSENTKNDLCDILNITTDKISVVHLGVSPETNAPAVDSFVAKEFSKPYILYVGNRRGYKNFHNLLVAFASNRRLRESFQLIAFGGGHFKPEEITFLKDLKIGDNQVRQVSGNDSLLAGLYSKSSLFVYPSFYEGFGLPPLEAMSYGCPVVCSNTKAVSEVVGNSAYFFEPTLPESISCAIEKVIFDESLKLKLRNNGFQRIKYFSWRACAEKTLRIYRNNN